MNHDDHEAIDKHIQGGPIRILSIDGGGIYGMTSALWLRQLCEREPAFLSGKDVDLFVGCSSGACNALLLAMHDRPREVVLDGVLERFWSEPGTFSNSNPLGAMLSFTGQVGWFGERDFRDQLTQYMGSTRMGELPQYALISTYDWYGRERHPDLEVDDPSPRSEPSLEQLSGQIQAAGRRAEQWRRIWTELMLSAGDPNRLAEAWQSAAGEWTRAWEDFAQLRCPGADQGDCAADPDDDPDGARQAERDKRREYESITDSYRHWQPKLFNNLRSDTRDRHCLIAEVAYGAATPPGFRALRGGIGDGASFSANPSVQGIAAVVRHVRAKAIAALERHPLLAMFHHRHAEVTGTLLSRIRMLSLGDGTRQPYFWQPDSNYGFKTWGDKPANPWLGHWYGPNAYALQASDEESTEIAWQLLGQRYFRLNPGINDMPTVLAAYYARWPQMRRWLLQHIQLSASDRPCRTAIDQSLEFLRGENWLGKHHHLERR